MKAATESALRQAWLVNPHDYQHLLDMLLNDRDAPEHTSRRQWMRLRNLQRRLRSASQRAPDR